MKKHVRGFTEQTTPHLHSPVAEQRRAAHGLLGCADVVVHLGEVEVNLDSVVAPPVPETGEREKRMKQPTLLVRNANHAGEIPPPATKEGEEGTKQSALA